MPKIDAPTVAEHHQRRRAALLAAAAEILATEGLDALSLGAVGIAAGLARSSVYQYFDSTPALVAALVEDAMPRALDELSAGAGVGAGPVERVETYVRSALALATDPTHRALASLAHAPLPPECAARLAEMHQGLLDPLRSALEELGVPEPTLTATLVMGTVQAASRAVLAGLAVDTVLERTLALLHGDLTAHAGAPDPRGGTGDGPLASPG